MSARPEPVTTAHRLVAERYPAAAAAFLGGSVTSAHRTPTSDLDVTVVLDSVPAPHRESIEYDGWPVELFVHDVPSVRRYVERDRVRRRPTMARLVAEGLALVDGEVAIALRAECAVALASGPPALTAPELAARRYALTDLLDDLDGAGAAEERVAIALSTWQAAGELRLAAGGRWLGTGKWLVRELADQDRATGTSYAAHLHGALVSAVAGDVAPLTAISEGILDRVGGRLWVGYRAEGEPG